ncbi:MAG: Calx-beta domain-containing protein, partial [Planctomycetota bacterium]
MFKRLNSLAFVVLLLGPATGAWSLTVGPGQTVTITDAQSDTYLMVQTGGTLIIESGGSLTITTSGDNDCSINGGEMIVNGGAFLVTGAGRFNLGQGAGGTITMNDGTFTVEGDWKFCDSAGGQSRLYLDGGTVHADNIELRGERDGKIVISDGILRLDDTSGENQDPHDWVEDEYLEPAEGYDDIVIEDVGGYTEVSAVKYPPTAQFEASSSGALESVWFATLTVNLSKAQAETVMVDYAVTGGTADGNWVDYAIDPSPLTFYPYQMSKMINILITTDGFDEEDETIEVTLTGVSGGEVILGDTVQHTYTIIDLRPKVSFSSGSSSGGESVTPAYIEVGLSWPTDETVTVDYMVTGGTAEGNGVDYTLLGDGTLTFDPCETLEYISIAIVDDPCEEIPETIELTLSNPTGNARLGDGTEHTFTITEQLLLLRGAFYFRADSDPSARIGPHPDIMVRLGDSNDKLIFRRDKGYLPVWYTDDSGEEDLPVEIVRVNCENTINPFSRVSIIETNPARAIVHWRYAPDCSNIGVTGWVDEYFTVYPDGVCMRTVKDAAGTNFAQWQAATPDIYG